MVTMQNIDILYALQPAIVIVIASALLIYWRRKRHFHISILLYSLIAYAAAMALKFAVQIPTIGSVTSYFGLHSVGLGVYYGLQTVIFEVGIAFVVAWFAVSRGKLDGRDAEGYGSGLAFWENAAYLGILPLINIIAYFVILSTNTPLAQTVYNQLNASAPLLFAPPTEALGLVALGILERVSSILIHFAWGYLCLMAAYYRKKWLFLIALPMGFIDFLVPFAQNSIVIFEGVVFALSVLSVVVAWFAVRHVRKSSENNTVEQNVSS